uniref:Uncharacterized protein n=1 Tax=Utricularia reniformis TaxID=192314 RepID=A0A1Y0B4H4_9LAMI|nr:hypothetical protein AEK19_MT2134 [Utricularia reniformis]ART32284.1 hypothetical protein AEK19_MT2134 [Utricularia reniformis]
MQEYLVQNNGSTTSAAVQRVRRMTAVQESLLLYRVRIGTSAFSS